MKDAQLGAGINMIVAEFEKLAMCKRGQINTEFNKRRMDDELWKEPN